MKIKKFDGGGFATFTPIINSRPQQQAGATETKKTSSLLDESTYKELLTSGGLVNDVNNLVNYLIKLETDYDNPFMDGDNRSQALKLIGKINELKQSKANWEKAVSTAKSEGGLNEVAVGTSNEVYAKDKNNRVTAISLSDYTKNRDKLQLLTVSELMNERQYNPQLAGQNQLFSVAENAIGMEKISKSIKSIVSVLGTETTAEDKYVSKEQLANITGSKPTNEEVSSLNNLKRLLDESGGYLKVTTTSSSERKHIDKAIDYIWGTLGSAAQQKLKATAVINGVDSPKRYILDLLQAGTDESIKVETSYMADPLSKQKQSEAKEKVQPISIPELFHNDRLYRPGTTYELNNPNAKVSIRMTATGVGPLFSLNKAGETIAPTTITDILSKDSYDTLLDKNNAFIGDTKVNPLLLSEIAYTGDDVAKVYMPVRQDGTPDLGQMEKFNQAYQIFNANKNYWSISQAQDSFRRMGFSGVQIKETQMGDGSVSKVIAENGKVKPFLALPIITNSASDISENAWMVEVKGSEKGNAEKLMETSFTVLGGSPSKPKYINRMPSSMMSLETPYKGSIFIAYRPDSSAILRSKMGNLVGKVATEQDLYRNLNFTNPGNSTNASASMLNN